MAVQRLPGRTGDCAGEVAKYLQPHLDKEDECTLPLLGLLQVLAAEKITLSEARQGSRIYSRLKEEYSQMTSEHRELFKLMEQLKMVGMEEGHLTAVRFAETMERHTQDEEELLYPAALLAGKLASQRAAGKAIWARTTGTVNS
jgi:hemerythrin-like domain-containing protein